MKETLELTVPELCCADEAQQIQAALGRLDGVANVRTLASTHKTLIAYETERIDPGAIRRAIAALGMTVTESATPAALPRRSLADRLGWAFVTVIAAVTLVGIAGERLGLVETMIEQIPSWLTLAAVLGGGYPIFRNVVRALRNRAVTSHALMTLGILGAVAIGQYAAAALIVFFMRLADFIEGQTTERARQAIKELLTLAPQTAWVLRDGREEVVPAEQVRRGEVVLVKPGERIPVDGAVVDGRAAVDEASITGESVPVEKQPGHHVYAATICERGALRIRTERVGRDTTFGRIVRLVEEAEAAKAPVQRFADRFTAYYIPVVLAIALVTLAVTGNATAAVATVLVACACAIAMATPITVVAAVGHGARRGIVIKGGRYLEALAKVDTLVIDKTGTLTLGRPEVTDVAAVGGADEDEALALAAAVERRSEHPLAAGIVSAAARRGLRPPSVTDFEAHPGKGIVGRIDGDRVWVGTEELMERAQISLDPAFRERVARFATEGKSVALVARGPLLVGAVALADTLRPQAAAALDALRALGVRHLLLLTGDRPEAARVVAQSLNLEFQAGVLPEGKIETIRRLQQEGRTVAMIGDGVNDAPALAQADVGIAMGAAGTDVAIEAAHVALMQDDWRVVPEAVRIGRRAFRTIKQNLWFTAAYNAVGILLAATGWLPPVVAAAAQSLPDVVVMLNSARLRGSR